MKRIWLAIVLASAANGCSAQPLPNAVEPSPAGGIPNLTVEVRGPSRIAYDPISVGVGAHEVVLTLGNTGAVSAIVGDVRVAYAAQRGGIAVPCEERRGVQLREPHTIPPGARAAYVRTLDCSMPIPGRYDVRVLASWSEGPLREVGGFVVDVVDAAGRGPKPIVGRAGLSAVIAGAQLSNPTTDWQATIALLNEGPRVQPVGAMRVVLRSHPLGKTLWCIGPATELTAPEVLAPGRMHVIRTRLACDLTTPGIYVIMAELVLPGSTEPSEIGDMQVRVTNDPIELTPLSPPLP